MIVLELVASIARFRVLGARQFKSKLFYFLLDFIFWKSRPFFQIKNPYLFLSNFKGIFSFTTFKARDQCIRDFHCYTYIFRFLLFCGVNFKYGPIHRSYTPQECKDNYFDIKKSDLENSNNY